ncbi:GlxA family transcriptional regulator [uncultured Roseibium sp.]|uniref:GlxA family transcriptional regulator n=1 Tax=uncultured Roseibium sp. TaxID=1936171 RepID=UPI00321684EE
MDGQSPHPSTEHFEFLLVENFSHLAFSCAVEPLRLANYVSQKRLYSWSFASEDGRFARASNGSETRVSHSFNEVGRSTRSDYLFLLSGIGVQSVETANLLSAFRRGRAHGSRVGALCSGTYILASAGFLDQQKAAIHWDYHETFMEEFPQVRLSRSVFVAEAPIITASGGSATADLILYLIRQKHGEDLATQVADQMIYNAVRDAEAAQRVSWQSRHGIRNEHLIRAIQFMSENMDDPPPASVIARKLGISGRQLERLFGRYLNCSPKKYYVDLRLQKAQRLLIQTDMSVTEVAYATGFKSPTHFSRVYRAQFGILPSEQHRKMD